MKKVFLILFLPLIVCIAAGIFILNNFDIKMMPPWISEDFDISKNLDWNNQLNLKQKGNTCGAHASMAVMYVTKKEVISPYEIYDSFNKLDNGYVLPWEVTKYLKANGVKAKIFNFWVMNDLKKNQWIKKNISHNKPVIIIIGSKRYLHYVTVLGYRNRKYSVYDSEVINDMNKSNPGNIDLDEIEIMKKMNEAAFKGINIKLMISEET